MATPARWPPNDRRPRRLLPRSAEAEDPTSLPARLHQARLRAFLEGSTTDPAEMDSLEALLARTANLYAQAINESTRKTYARRWRLFVEWCEMRDLQSLPASSETVMLYLADATGQAHGAALGTLRGWLAAINRVHVEAGHPPPGDDPAMAMLLRTLRRIAPPTAPADQMSALKIGPLRQVCRMLDSVTEDPVEVRDKALLVLHRAGVGDGEIARLRWEDVAITQGRATVLLRSVRADRRDRTVTIPRREDVAVCGLNALRGWRQVAGTDIPWVITQTSSHGGRDRQEWTPRDIFRIRKARGQSLGGDLDTRIALLGGVPSEVLRDKAILLLGFAGAFRRPDLVGFRWPDITVSDGGLIARLRRSKTDTEGHGVDVGIPRGSSPLTCPVTAMERWRERVVLQLGEGPAADAACFGRIGRSGRIETESITPEALTRLVCRRLEEAGIEGRWGGRSLRRGFISTAADLGIRLEDIARQSRHATLDSLVRYIASDDPFRNNPASQLGM